MRKLIIVSIILVLILVMVQKCGRKDSPVSNDNNSSIVDSSKPKIVFGDKEKRNEDPGNKGDWPPGIPWDEYKKPSIDNDIHIILQPALGYLYDGRHKLDLDFRIVRWRNLGLNVGTGLSFNPIGAVGWGGLSYRFTNFTNKIEVGVFMGVTTQKHLCVGLRIAL